jgi:hypothetical protein
MGWGVGGGGGYQGRFYLSSGSIESYSSSIESGLTLAILIQQSQAPIRSVSHQSYLVQERLDNGSGDR